MIHLSKSNKFGSNLPQSLQLLKRTLWTLAVFGLFETGLVVPGITGPNDNHCASSNLVKTKDSKEDSQIIFHKKGQIIRLNLSSRIYTSLEVEIVNLLTSSNNAIYELVLHETIKNIKKKSAAIELIYVKPKKIIINNPVLNNKEVSIDRILIPLSGYYSPKTIFYGHKYYFSGPVTNDAGNQKIKSILLSAGINPE